MPIALRDVKSQSRTVAYSAGIMPYSAQKSVVKLELKRPALAAKLPPLHLQAQEYHKISALERVLV